jgi:arginine/lysine/ornithine decarboxylase
VTATPMAHHIGDGHAMVDPIKVTILTPGMSPSGTCNSEGFGLPCSPDSSTNAGSQSGRPAPIASWCSSLSHHPGQSRRTARRAPRIQTALRPERPLNETLPGLVEDHPECNGRLTLRELADWLQSQTHASNLTVRRPARPSRRSGTTEVDKLAGCVSGAAMVVPTRPVSRSSCPVSASPPREAHCAVPHRESGARH